MPYQPPLHVIKKDQPKPSEPMLKVVSRASKISNWTLTYRIRGMALGIALAWAYCYFVLGDFPVKYLIAGPIVGWLLGHLVGRFFYRD